MRRLRVARCAASPRCSRVAGVALLAAVPRRRRSSATATRSRCRRCSPRVLVAFGARGRAGRVAAAAQPGRLAVPRLALLAAIFELGSATRATPCSPTSARCRARRWAAWVEHVGELRSRRR